MCPIHEYFLKTATIWRAYFRDRNESQRDKALSILRAKLPHLTCACPPR